MRSSLACLSNPLHAFPHTATHTGQAATMSFVAANHITIDSGYCFALPRCTAENSTNLRLMLTPPHLVVIAASTGAPDSAVVSPVGTRSPSGGIPVSREGSAALQITASVTKPKTKVKSCCRI